jgi:hypothetical protein
MSSGDGEYLPIVKVAPIYPRRAQTRGISGLLYCGIHRNQDGFHSGPVCGGLSAQGYL